MQILRQYFFLDNKSINNSVECFTYRSQCLLVSFRRRRSYKVHTAPTLNERKYIQPTWLRKQHRH